MKLVAESQVPRAAWIWGHVIEATQLGRQRKFLIHDRDAHYGGDFDERLGTLNIIGVRTPPRADAIAERIVRTIRSESVAHLIVINEPHLRAVLAEFAAYHNRDRPRRALSLEAPIPTPARARGRVDSSPILGGLHHACA